MNVKLYVEGGGDTGELKTKCRQGFATFFGKTDLAGRRPRIVACGGRQKAYDKFRTAVTHAKDDEFVILLVDSEDLVTDGSEVWTHLQKRDQWNTPEGATEDNAYLMVVCMESWFLADKDALECFFGNDFKRNALPQREDIERVSKNDLFRGLGAATKQSKKGSYDKGRHSFAILAKLNPARVEDASPHAKRLLRILNEAAPER